MENEMMTEQNNAAVAPSETSTTRPVVEEKGLAKEALLVSGAILLASLIIAGSILTLASRGTTSVNANANNGAANQPAAANEPEDTTAVTSIDNDPVLGDKKKAKVAIVEFTDFECPFCKKFHADTFDALVKDYVDTGKAIIVTRDFPLSFHDPKATEAAALAECVRKEKGDAGYFAFTKAYYQNTLANGKGLPEGKQVELIGKVGANAKSVATCAATDAVKQEIASDITAGGAAGVSGTPSFVIGTLASDGTVTGERVVGALPIEGFRVKIEQYLAK